MDTSIPPPKPTVTAVPGASAGLDLAAVHRHWSALHLAEQDLLDARHFLLSTLAEPALGPQHANAVTAAAHRIAVLLQQREVAATALRALLGLPAAPVTHSDRRSDSPRCETGADGTPVEDQALEALLPLARVVAARIGSTSRRTLGPALRAAGVEISNARLGLLLRHLHSEARPFLGGSPSPPLTTVR